MVNEIQINNDVYAYKLRLTEMVTAANLCLRETTRPVALHRLLPGFGRLTLEVF